MRNNIDIAILVVTHNHEEYIDKLLQNFSPSEILIQKNNRNQCRSVSDAPDTFHQAHLGVANIHADHARTHYIRSHQPLTHFTTHARTHLR